MNNRWTKNKVTLCTSAHHNSPTDVNTEPQITTISLVRELLYFGRLDRLLDINFPTKPEFLMRLCVHS